MWNTSKISSTAVLSFQLEKMAMVLAILLFPCIHPLPKTCVYNELVVFILNESHA